MDDRAGHPALEAVVAVGRLAALLAAVGEAGLADGLALLVEALGLRSAVLRDMARGSDGPLRAVAGEVVHAVPSPTVRRRSPWTAEPVGPPVELPVTCAGRTVAVLTVVGARPSQLAALRAAAAVLALALSRDPDEMPPELPAQLVAADEHAWDALADALHDGPVQLLVAARYAADAAVRGGDPGLAREAVQEALVALRRTLWQLRPRGDRGLVESLQVLGARLEESGRPGLNIRVDAQVDLTGPAAVAAYRLVQAASGAVPDLSGSPERTAAPWDVVLRAEGHLVVLEIDGAVLADPQRWVGRAQALGGTLSVTARGVRLALPCPASDQQATRLLASALGSAPTMLTRPLLPRPKVTP